MSTSQPKESRRESIGRLCIIAAIFGFSVALVAVLPLLIFQPWFWSGMSFRHSPEPPTAYEIWAAFFRDFAAHFASLALYFIVPSALLLWCGLRLRKTVGQSRPA